MKFRKTTENVRKINNDEYEIEEVRDEGNRTSSVRFRINKSKLLEQIKELEAKINKKWTDEELIARAKSELIEPEREVLKDALSSLKEQLTKLDGSNSQNTASHPKPNR